MRKEPGVQQCKVIGIPDAHYGEAVCACIQKRPEGIDLTESDVYQLLCTHVAHFKVPKYILFFDSLPCTETGKVRISELQQLVQARLEKEETPRT